MTVDELKRFQQESDGDYEFTGLIDAQDIDREVAETPCETCGTVRKYAQVLDGGSYYAFSVCYPCDDVEEF